jgi:acyl-CoA thioester hydrolase
LLELFEPGNEAAWLASFRFGVEVRPRYCEVDALGHVSNTVYPAYLEFGRLQYFIAARDPETGPFAFAHVTAELHLRYVAACFYDEPLIVRSKLVALGRSSATMEQAVVGAGNWLRALSRIAVVRTDGERTAPWTPTQRAALEAFEGREFPAKL